MISYANAFLHFPDPHVAHALTFPIVESVRSVLSCLSPMTGAGVLCVLTLLTLPPTLPCPPPN